MDNKFWNFVYSEKVNLFVGFATIFAGALAVVATLDAIDNQNRLHETSRSAKLEAARATLPLALSELHLLCRNHIIFAIDGNRSRRSSDWTASELALSTIRECIELTQGEIQSTLKEIAAIYQIMMTRSRTIFNDGENIKPIIAPEVTAAEKHGRTKHICEWMSFLFVIESLFDFGRERSDRPSERTTPEKLQLSIESIEYNGKQILQDEEVRKTFESIVRDSEFAFNKPDWIKKKIDIKTKPQQVGHA